TLFFGLAALGIFMFFVGRWQERFGMRKMIAFGTLLTAVNLLTIAFADHLWMLYLWSFLNGAACCFVYTPAMTSVQRWFVQRRGLASGAINFTFGIAAAVTSPLFHRLLEGMGYVGMILSVAGATLVMGMLAVPFTEGPDHLAKREPSSGPAVVKVNFVHGRSLTVKECLATKSFWFLWLTWAFQGAAGIAMVSVATIYGLSKGFSMESAVLVLTAFNLMNGIGRIIMGFLSDLVNRTLAMSTTFFAAAAAYLLLPHVAGVVGTAFLAAVIGLSFGTLFVVSSPLAADCFGTRHFGAILGLVFTAYGFIAGLLGPSLSGYILDNTGGNFTVIFAYLAIFCMMAGIFIRFVIPPDTASEPAASLQDADPESAPTI
ncbi:MFS transporter, partial [Geomonas sp.]|uniref:MFS transporter n=1 Tax=Geomonas sp. TaxID=2651584 RepID=UPI002B49BF6D